MASVGESMKDMLAAFAEMAAAAREAQRKCAELAVASECYHSLVGTLSTLDEVCRVQRACLSPEVVTTRGSIQRALADESAKTSSSAAAPTSKGARPPTRPSTASSATAKRKAAAMEDFRDKLPRKYQSEEGVAMMLRLRKFVRDSAAEGVTLAQVREELGATQSLMACSQVLEVLCRLGMVVREARGPKSQGVRYYTAGPKARKH
jgi:hypothetical protein